MNRIHFIIKIQQEVMDLMIQLEDHRSNSVDYTAIYCEGAHTINSLDAVIELEVAELVKKPHVHVFVDGQRFTDIDIGFCPTKLDMAVNGQIRIEEVKDE